MDIAPAAHRPTNLILLSATFPLATLHWYRRQTNRNIHIGTHRQRQTHTYLHTSEHPYTYAHVHAPKHAHANVCTHVEPDDRCKGNSPRKSVYRGGFPG
jgi:hypothetical protein